MGHATTTAYTETDGLTTQTKVTNPLSHAVTTTLDPGYGVATAIVDASAPCHCRARVPLRWVPGTDRPLPPSPAARGGPPSGTPHRGAWAPCGARAAGRPAAPPPA